MNPQVLLLGSDLWELGYIDKLPKVVEKKTFGRDKLIQNEIQFTVKNFDDFFSVDNPKSIFSNIRWRYKDFKWYDSDGILRWDGIIRDIVPDYEKKIAKIISSNVLAKFLNHNIAYTSDTWETPAEAFLNIADQIGFTAIDRKSAEDSIAVYEENNAYIKCYFFQEDDITFQQAIDKISMIGAADIFGENNILHFELYREFTGGVVANITEGDMLKLPKVKSLESELINNYSINYVGSSGVPATDENSLHNIGRISRQDENNGIHDMAEIDGTEGNEIEIKDKTSAVFFGESNIRRTHKDLDNSRASCLRGAEFILPDSFEQDLTISSFYRMDLSDEAWSGKLFETYETTLDSDKNTLKLFGVER